MPGHSKINLTVVTKIQGKCRCNRNERDQHFLLVHRNSKWLELIFYCSPAFTKKVEVKIRSAQPPWMQIRLETDPQWWTPGCRPTAGRPSEADPQRQTPLDADLLDVDPLDADPLVM